MHTLYVISVLSNGKITKILRDLRVLDDDELVETVGFNGNGFMQIYKTANGQQTLRLEINDFEIKSYANGKLAWTYLDIIGVWCAEMEKESVKNVLSDYQPRLDKYYDERETAIRKETEGKINSIKIVKNEFAKHRESLNTEGTTL